MSKFLKLLVVLVIFPTLLHAASFEKYAPKLLKFEGAGYGIHKPVWGDREFTKKEALEIFRKHYWNRFYGDYFKSQDLAEVIIDHLINAGEGHSGRNVKSIQAILGVKQTGKLSLSDIITANKHPNPNELVNALVKYRVLYYRGLSNFATYPGWETRARSFFIADSRQKLTDYQLPAQLEARYRHIRLTA